MADEIKRLLIFWLMFFGMFLGGFAFGRLTVPAETPIPHQVADKGEFDNHCYVAVWLEVTPEEFIGLDIGDEYEIK